MHLFLSQKPNIKNFFSILLAILPISFIAGNMIININVILIIISCLLIYKKEVFKIKYLFLDKTIFLFFFTILFTGIYNNIFFLVTDAFPKGYNTILKSFFFLKYLLLYLIFRFLTEKKLIIFKIFFISCFLCTIFVSLDIFYQFIYGKDVFGFQTIGSGRRLAGPFGDELIAGGYLQRFSFFSFFLLPLFFYHQSVKYSKYIIPILFFIFFSGIILSGNRMPMLLFIFTIFLTLIFQKQTRKYLIPFILIFLIIFSSVYNLNSEVKNNFNNFYKQINKMIVIAVNRDFQNENSPQYLKEFSSFYDTWLINKYIGGGIKNFRYYCHVRNNIDKNSKFVCNMHPHNYYLEILTETGIIGFSIIVLIFIQVIYLTFIKRYFVDRDSSENNLIVPFIFLFIAEIFPLKSTGSFFTTGNSTYLFLILAILIGLSQTKNSIENKY